MNIDENDENYSVNNVNLSISMNGRYLCKNEYNLIIIQTASNPHYPIYTGRLLT